MACSFSWLRSAGLVLAGAFVAVSAHAATLTTQLGFLIDESGSIAATDFAKMKAGYASAIQALPTDGSIQVTIFSFSTSTTQIVAPTVVTAASLASIVNAVNAHAQAQGSTATAAGITAISDAMVHSALFSTGLRSIINIATDGFPNIPVASPQTAAIAAATASRAEGIDALTAEVIGGTTDPGFMQDIVFSPVTGPCNNCGVVLPDGSTPPNPMTNTPWVLMVNNYDDFDRAINAKVQAIVNPVPEPGALVLVGTALAAALGFSRRRSSAR
jgi:uncharacterized protein YegL